MEHRQGTGQLQELGSPPPAQTHGPFADPGQPPGCRMRAAICFLPHLANNTHVAPWRCKKGRAHPWAAVGSGDRSWAPSAPRDKSFACSSRLQSCLKAAEQRGRAPPSSSPWAPGRAPCSAGAAQLQGTSTARAEPRAPSASSLSPSVELSARHASCPEGRKAVGEKHPLWGL